MASPSARSSCSVSVKWVKPCSTSPTPRQSAKRGGALASTSRWMKELGEIERAGSDDERAGEMGDLLFSVVNYARHLGVNPETALREATSRFEARFRKVEELADKPLKDMAIEELEALWQRAKTLV